MVERTVGKMKFLFLYISAGLGATLLPLIIDYFHYYSDLNTLIEAGFHKNEIVETLNSGMINTGWEKTLGAENMKRFTGLNFYNASLGASGAVMGVLAAFGFMFPNAKLMLLFPPIPIKAKYLIGGMIGADLISAFLTGTPLLGSSNIGYLAHVGGAITGLIIAWSWKKNEFNKHRWN